MFAEFFSLHGARKLFRNDAVVPNPPPTDEWVVELGYGHDDRAYMRAVCRVVRFSPP